MNLSALRRESEAMRDRIVALRRDLHRHPELAFEELRTAGIVAEALSALGYEVQTGVGKTGVVGVMEGERATPHPHTLLIRFDMDALPIQEQVDVPFKSIYDGKMHACGHDAHTAIGIGVAELLSRHRNQWGGIVKFVFQPAEEIVAGALAMIHDGVLERPKPDRVLSMHIWADEEVGVVGITEGPALAASGAFTITVRGRGSHGASPDLGVDPILASAHIVTALQSIVARNVSPLRSGVVTVGSIHGGTAPNIIPDTVEMRGTVRAFEDGVMALLRERIVAITTAVAAALGAQAQVVFSEHGTPATVNDPRMAELAREVAAQLPGVAHLRTDYRTMGAEDCAYFLRAAPGAYLFVGAGNRARGITEPHHSPRFQIDEEALPLGVALMTACALRFLNDAPDVE
ncbi:MAG: M20 family metallopeptidase [Anaerolineae bacterium]|nr:M20 family metallopeptidase [Thermoflexales bacterium]MDW8396119.1 M20 family metallopeptidase [Anaerolineae bacterium]